MNQKVRKVLLITISICIVLLLIVGVSYAFMKPNITNTTITTVDVKSCAKVTLTDKDSTPINLTDTYPMSENKGMQTIPYTFNVSSTCETYSGFNLYLTTIATNTLEDSIIRYAITLKDSKEPLATGLLSEAEDGSIDFDDNELKQLELGLNAEYNKIYKVVSLAIPYQSERDYDLYLWIDADATNESMGSSFQMGVSLQSYDREAENIGDACIGLNMAECFKANYQLDNTIYFHNSDLAEGANDGSYRYAGSSDAVNNYVCFGSDAAECPNENLYRIIGVFGDQVKLIKGDFATNDLLGTETANGTYVASNHTNYKGSLSEIPRHYWSGSSSSTSNTWSISTLNTIALNTNYINNIGSKWADMIETTTWKVGGMTIANGIETNAQTAYNYEVGTNATDNPYSAKVGLMYVSEYYYAASPTYWSYQGYNSSDATQDYRAAIGENWLYSGIFEWTISPRSDGTNGAFLVTDSGHVLNDSVNDIYYGIRPSFNLVAETKLISGYGTKSEPYRIG